MPKAANMRADEILAQEVQKYPCIYDKTDSGHKEKDRVNNAWREIDRALDVEEGEAKRRFENLKKRYSKRRKALKKATRSGAGSKEASSAENLLKEYEFLSWLNPYIRVNSSEDNLPESSIDDGINGNESEDAEDRDSLFGADDVISSEKSSIETPIETQTSAKKKIERKSNNKDKWSKKNLRESKELELMDKIQRSIEAPIPAPKEQDADDVFGLMVAKELKQLPSKRKRKLKHEINNLIFQYQEDEDDCSLLTSTPHTSYTQMPRWNPTNSSAQMSINAPWPLAGLNLNLEKQH